MAVTRHTLDLLDGMRVTINSHVDDVTRRLVAAWARAWDEIVGEWHEALDQVIESISDKQWPSVGEINRLDRATRALKVSREKLEGLAHLTGVTVHQALPAVLAAAVDYQERLVLSQLPTTADAIDAGVSIAFNRVDERAVEAIVRRTTGQVTSYTSPLSVDAEDAMHRALVRGVLVGDNPRVVAADMLERVEGEFNGGLARAVNIARTEMLDASRAGGSAADAANPKLVTGWYWNAVLDERTCPSCWSQNGSFHPADEQGPDDHQSGRCARVTATQSWADLGFDIPEPPSLLATQDDTEDRFHSLPPNKQLAIMGRERLELLQSGRIGWSDLSVKRTSDGWRDSYAPRSVKALRALAS